MRLACAVLALVCCLLIIRYDSRVDRAIVQVIYPAPWSITWLVTVTYEAGSLGVVIVLVALALIARRWLVARDIALSAAGAAAVAGILIAVLGSRGGRPAGVVIAGYDLSFPVVRIALFMAVSTAALPYLARGMQRLVEIFIALTALATAVGGHGLPLNVGGSLAIGWGAAVAVRLVFGSPLGLPSANDVQLLLQEIGVGASDVRPVTRQVWGVARYQGTETRPDGSPGGRLGIEVYGRDAADARLLTKAGRFLLYRIPGRPSRLPGCSRSSARLTSRCGRARRVPPCPSSSRREPQDRPRTRCWSAVCPRDRTWPEPTPPRSATSSSMTSTGSSNPRRRGSPMGLSAATRLRPEAASNTMILTEFRNASSSASPDQLDRDAAGAMAATAMLAGPNEPRAPRPGACRRRSSKAPSARLHALSLDPALRRDLRKQRDLLPDVRQRAAAASIELPTLVEPRRVSWPTLIMVIGTLIGGWALIGVLQTSPSPSTR